jgi:type IV pilus assembly protein PilA
LIRSQVSEGAVLTDGAKTPVSEFYSNRGYFPKSNASAGLATDTSITGKYVSQVDVDTGGLGKIIATFGGQSNKAISGEEFILSATTSSGSIAWSCKPSTVDQKYLPSSCR